MTDLEKWAREAQRLLEYCADNLTPHKARLSAHAAACPLPRLRTRAEVDAEIVMQVRGWCAFPVQGHAYGMSASTVATLQRLCAEPTAPEPHGNLYFCHRCNRSHEKCGGDV